MTPWTQQGGCTQKLTAAVTAVQAQASPGPGPGMKRGGGNEVPLFLVKRPPKLLAAGRKESEFLKGSSC